MLIWFCLIVPVCTVIVLLLKFKEQVVWWEFLLTFLASILFISLAKLTVDTIQTSDEEYWGGWVVRAEYYEPWDELVTYTETTTDSKGRTQTRVKTRVDYHPAKWEVIDSNGQRLSVNSNTFMQLCSQFGNKSFVDLRRNYHHTDGDMYHTDFPNNDAILVPVTTAHRYENRVAVSDSIMNFPEVNPADYSLFEYPTIRGFYECDSILGSGDTTQSTANKLLNFWNAKLGASRQVRILILMFKNQPLQAGLDQESYWKGGNKNEFVITIGVNDNNEIQWCHPFSWTEVEQLKVETRNYIVSQKNLNLHNVVSYIVPEIQKKWIRKQFSDFSYISVDPPLWAVILVLFLTIGVNVAVGYWTIKNEHIETSFKRIRWR